MFLLLSFRKIFFSFQFYCAVLVILSTTGCVRPKIAPQIINGMQMSVALTRVAISVRAPPSTYPVFGLLSYEPLFICLETLQDTMKLIAQNRLYKKK